MKHCLIKKRKFVISLVCCLFITLSIGLMLCMKKNSEVIAENTKIKTVSVTSGATIKYDFESVYHLNDILDVSSLKVIYNGEEIEANTEMYFPDMSLYAKDEYVLNQEGIYTLYARASKNDSLIIADAQIKVIKYNFEMSLKSDQDKIEYQYDYASKDGTLVSLSNGGTLHYNTIIDVSKLTKWDVLFEFFPVVAEVGKGDFDNFEIKLIDVHDRSKHLAIQFSYYDQWKTGFWLAGSESQAKTGYQSAYDRIHYGSFGQESVTYFYLTKHDGSISRRPLQVRLDYAEKAIYVDQEIKRVIDLDDSKFFGTLWEGFTTGEVELEFTASNYLSDRPAQIFVTKIGNTDISVVELIDTICPNIEVDYDGYTKENLPKALINEKYKLFNAKSFDNSFNCDLFVSVYTNYYSNEKCNVNVKNGYFIPKSVEKHYIEYKAVDYSGNQTVEVVEIDVLNDWNTIQLNIDESIFKQEHFVGNLITIPTFTTSGGFGKNTTKVFVDYAGTTTAEIGDSLSYRPERIGTYTFRFEMTDYIGKVVTKSFDIVPKASNNPVFIDDVYYPKYLMAGYNYTFDKFYAYDFVSGDKKPVQAQTVVIDKDGEHLISETYTPNKLDTSVKVCYQAKTSTGVTRTDWVTIPVVDVINSDNWYNMANYFVGDNLSKQLTDTSIKLNTKENFDFINSLVADGLNLELSLTMSRFDADCLRIYLTDYVNYNEAITLDLRISNANKLECRLNGAEWNELSSYNSDKIIISYDNIASQLKCSIGDNYFTTTVKKTVSGNDFDCFSSGKVYLSFEFISATNDNEVEIYSINRQVFSTKKNNVKPSIGYTKDASYLGEKGQVYTIYRAVALDVLDPNVKFNLTVQDPNGDIVKDVNGLSLNEVDPTIDYNIKLDSFGVYYVSYYACDRMNRAEKNIGFAITVYDTNAPVITLQGKEVKEGNVGNDIFVPTATAVDEEDGSLEVKAYVSGPSGLLFSITGDGFKAVSKGKYVVYYSVYDSALNLSTYSYEIIIS